MAALISPGMQLTQSSNSLNEKGYIEFENLIPEDCIVRINELIEKPLNRPMINGRLGYIKKDNIRYLSSSLSWGREIIEAYTNQDIVQLMEHYVHEEVHLSNYRIYRSFPSSYERMKWHVDNKTDVYDEAKNRFINKVALHDKGIIMIVYLSNVEDGGLQIVSGSHQWSFKEDKENWDDRVNQFREQIVTFNNRRRGTVILYDYRCIHRAQPFRKGNPRTSLFGQYSPSFMPVGEPILLCTRDLDGLSDMQKRILNFNQTPSGENWPIGSVGDLVHEIGLPQTATSLMISIFKKLAKKFRLWPR